MSAMRARRGWFRACSLDRSTDVLQIVQELAVARERQRGVVKLGVKVELAAHSAFHRHVLRLGPVGPSLRSTLIGDRLGSRRLRHLVYLLLEFRIREFLRLMVMLDHWSAHLVEIDGEGGEVRERAMRL